MSFAVFKKIICFFIENLDRISGFAVGIGRWYISICFCFFVFGQWDVRG